MKLIERALRPAVDVMCSVDPVNGWRPNLFTQQQHSHGSTHPSGEKPAYLPDLYAVAQGQLERQPYPLFPPLHLQVFFFAVFPVPVQPYPGIEVEAEDEGSFDCSDDAGCDGG